MKEIILNFLEQRFEKNGYVSGATIHNIIVATKIPQKELVIILNELIADGKIFKKSGDFLDMYFIVK